MTQREQQIQPKVATPLATETKTKLKAAADACLDSKCATDQQVSVSTTMCLEDLKVLQCTVQNQGLTSYCTTVPLEVKVDSIPTDCGTIIGCTGTCQIPIELNVLAASCDLCQGYAFIYDTVSRPITLNAYGNMSFSNNTGIINGWTHVPGTADVTCNIAGIYNILLTANLQSTGGATRGVWRATKNGTEILGSQVYVDMQSTSITQPVTRTFKDMFAVGDILRIQAAGSRTAFMTVAQDFNGLSVTPTSAQLVITKDT